MVVAGRRSPSDRNGIDAVNKRIPSDATASDGIQGVEVAGIEPVGRRWERLVRGGDLR